MFSEQSQNPERDVLIEQRGNDKTIPEVPDFLGNVLLDKLLTVNAQKLYVGLLPVSKGKTQYVSIQATPHYVYARHIIYGDPVIEVSGYTSYDHYRALHPQTHSSGQYVILIKSIKSNGYDSTNFPILASRRRSGLLWLEERFYVVDGFHRLAVLAALGEEQIRIRTIK